MAFLSDPMESGTDVVTASSAARPLRDPQFVVCAHFRERLDFSPLCVNYSHLQILCAPILVKNRHHTGPLSGGKVLVIPPTLRTGGILLDDKILICVIDNRVRSALFTPGEQGGPEDDSGTEERQTSAVHGRYPIAKPTGSVWPISDMNRYGQSGPITGPSRGRFLKSSSFDARGNASENSMLAELNVSASHSAAFFAKALRTLHVLTRSPGPRPRYGDARRRRNLIPASMGRPATTSSPHGCWSLRFIGLISTDRPAVGAWTMWPCQSYGPMWWKTPLESRG